MSDIAIRVENLGKMYRIGTKQDQHKELRDLLADALAAPFRRAGKLLRGQASGAAELDETIWALKGVSFEVTRGEVVGVIGRNGAGKSTLLKILSRITDPTEGYVEVFGRVGSLLEVGTGFHPELTGRENVYLNGTILGMSRLEIDRKFDEIVAFSEIEKFIDTPVKHYSSGMYVRLAFAVAAHLDPEILLVDEVLAVGDLAFQEKCLAKMDNVARHGRTVLFVSHNMGAIQSLCERCLFIDAGRTIADGAVPTVVDQYISTTSSDNAIVGADISWSSENAPGRDGFKLCRVRLLDSAGNCQSHFATNDPVKIEMVFEVTQNLQGMRLAIQVMTQTGVIAFSSTNHRELPPVIQPGTYKSTCTIPGDLLNEGKYIVRVHAGIPGIQKLIEEQIRLQFMTTATMGHSGGASYFPEKWPGVVAPKLEWLTQEVEAIRP